MSATRGGCPISARVYRRVRVELEYFTGIRSIHTAEGRGLYFVMEAPLFVVVIVVNIVQTYIVERTVDYCIHMWNVQ